MKSENLINKNIRKSSNNNGKKRQLGESPIGGEDFGLVVGSKFEPPLSLSRESLPSLVVRAASEFPLSG